MKYRDILGFSKSKKKVIKEKSKFKKSTILGEIKKEIKKELNEWSEPKKIPKRWSKPFDKNLTEFENETLKEVGASAEYKKYTKSIEKNMDNLSDSVRELKNLLMKNGAEREAREVGSIYATSVGRFHKFLTTKFVRMIRKLL